MSITKHVEVLRLFAIDFALYSAYEDMRLVVERSEPVPLAVREFPYRPPVLSVFAALMLDPRMLGEPHHFSIEWAGIDGNVDARLEQPLAVPHDAVVTGPFPISFLVNLEGLRVSGPGTCQLRLALDGEWVEALPVDVDLASAPEPA